MTGREAAAECAIVGGLAVGIIAIVVAGVEWPGLIGPLLIAGTIGQKWIEDDA